ncbi:hypothetical protein F8M41_011260 [Gigaspora margarita]|uniref:F-box domain-containing protein n=1 Tax=Gigaspora margarita TaxID=4874 RepID=A0A8H3WZL6_GIGMA|nr:hypothetical protein F8M41_011260 [Gigaspora margarita]
MMKLPNECFVYIFNNLQKDYKSLYSCLLVNRHWCRIVVPILWSDIANKLNKSKLINTCLLALNAEEQASLTPLNINLPNNLEPLLFEYTSYTTTVSSSLNDGIIKWLKINGYEKDVRIFGSGGLGKKIRL